MSVDLLALLQGKPSSDRPGAVRTTPSSPSTGTLPSMGPGGVGITVGAYVIDVPPPTPLLVRTMLGSSLYYGGSSIDENRFWGPDGSGRYYFETATNMGTGFGTPKPPPADPMPGITGKPAIFYGALATGYTDAKTTTDVALDEKLYKALTRSTK